MPPFGEVGVSKTPAEHTGRLIPRRLQGRRLSVHTKQRTDIIKRMARRSYHVDVNTLPICTVGSNLKFTFPLPEPNRTGGRDRPPSLPPSRSVRTTEPSLAHTTTAARKTACA